MDISIGWPQGIYLCLLFVGIGAAMARFGKPKTDTYDWSDVLFGPLIVLSLLYWGGFFG